MSLYIWPTSTNIPYVNVTELFSSEAVMFVLIILSICLLTIIDIFTSCCKLGRCITFIVNLTYCILPNELTFKIKYPNYTLIWDSYCIIISICPSCRRSILLFFICIVCLNIETLKGWSQEWPFKFALLFFDRNV
jgi:hypothetical protein